MTIKENSSALKKEILIVLIVFSSIAVWFVNLPIVVSLIYIIISSIVFVFLFFRKIEFILKINTIEIKMSLFGKVYEKYYYVFKSINVKGNAILFMKNNEELVKIDSGKADGKNKLDALKVTFNNKKYKMGNRKNAQKMYENIEEFYNLKRIFGSNG